MIFRLEAFSTAGLLAVLMIAVPSSGAAGQESKAGNPSRGAQAWANNCSRCHNMRDPSEFRDDQWEPIVQHMRVRAGLTGQQARDILTFLQSSNYRVTGGGTADTEEARNMEATEAEESEAGMSGKQVYSQTCLACHGADGTGALPGVPNLRKRLGSKSDDVLLKHIKEGFQSPGSTMAMPARGGNPDLSDTELKRALSYVRSQFAE